MRLVSPVVLLRLEGAALFFGSLLLYHRLGPGWTWFAVLFFVPDVSIAGYLASARLGWGLYNLAHSYLAPLLVLGAAVAGGGPPLVAAALIWCAHISWDRMLAFGLKEGEDFWTTHLGTIRGGRRLWERVARRG